MPKRVLIQLDCDPQPSTFDAIVAVDAGADVLLRASFERGRLAYCTSAVPGLAGDVMLQPAAWIGVHGLTLLTVALAATPLLGRRAVAAH